MKRRVLLALALVAGLSACKSGDSTPPPSMMNPSADGGGLPPNADLASSVTVGDLAGSTGGDTATLQLSPFTVPAGTEVYKCQDFANPFGGANAEVREFESHMTPGSHHLLLFFKAGATNGALADCSGLEIAPGPYGSQTPDDSVTYPDKVASLIDAKNGFRLQVHYVNATGAPLNVAVTVTMHLAAPGTVTDHAGVFFFNNVNLFIPSTGMPVTATKTCTIPSDVNVLVANSHMHQHATGFQALTGGTSIFTTTDWNEPKPATFAPPLVLKAGSQVTFTCTYVNSTGQPIYFGEHALTDEMCIFTGQFYPATGVLGCQ
jgi:hypothetical protein